MSAGIRHRLVLLDPRCGALLVERRGDRWRLPELVLDERHTAEVEHLNAAVRARWGIATAALRSLEHSDTGAGPRRTQALERLGESSPAPLPIGAAIRWINADEMDGVDLPAEEREWARRGLETGPAEDRGWTRPGWWTAARHWIESQVGPADIVQTRAWESSCVARVRSLDAPPGAHYFFKAVPTTTPREVQITAHLSRKWGGSPFPGVPDVVGAEVERAWLLMRAFDGNSLDDTREPGAWERAAATYGRLQAATLGQGGEFCALGCVERRLVDLAEAIDPLCADTPALLPGHPEGLTAEQVRSLRALGPHLRRRCATLAGFGLPAALDHGDLWPSNFLDNGRECIVIDWEDAGVHHPFLSLGPFVLMLREWRVPLAIERLADVYLPPFATEVPLADLRRAFRTALPLGLVEMAVRYWRVPSTVSALHPWMREMVPLFLRHALEIGLGV